MRFLSQLGLRHPGHRESAVWLTILALVWLWLSWPFISGQACLGFRDTAHFYFPLFQWIDAQRAVGPAPHWIPYDAFGLPLIADAGTCRMYPLQLVLAWPGLSFPARFGFYVMLHLLTAIVGAFVAARRLQLSPAASAFAAISYGLGGVTLSQTCNLVYLIGSAWLPWLLWGTFAARQVPTNQRTPPHRARSPLLRVVGIALPLALLILGGDPQAAYLGLGIVWGTAFANALHCRWKNEVDTSPRRITSRRQIGGNFLGTVIAATILAALLSAAAWLPMLVWNQASVREYTTVPRSIWEWLTWPNDSGEPPTDVAQREDRPPPMADATAAGEMQATYEFSLSPWSLAEAVAPQLWGRLYPLHRRWDAGLPAADRIWFPSVYPGVAATLLLLAALVAPRFRRRPPRDENRAPTAAGALVLERRVLVVLAVLGILGSFGWYGLGWLWREVAAAVGSAPLPAIAPQAGGVYWVLQWLLPGFCQFRYPAKLLVLASLAVPLLAAMALDQLPRADGVKTARRFRRVAVFHGGLCLLGLGAVWVWRGPLQRIAIPADSSFGPFDGLGAIGDLQRSLGHAALVALVLSGLVWRMRRIDFGSAWIVRAVAMLTLLDLAVANYWLLPRVPAPSSAPSLLATASPSEIPSAVTAAVNQDLAPAQVDLLARSVDPQWAEHSSPRRLEEILDFERATDFPKFHLLRGLRIFPAFNSIEPQDLVWLQSWLTEHPQTAATFWRLAGRGVWTRPSLQCIPPLREQPTATEPGSPSTPAVAALRTQTRWRPHDQAVFRSMIERDLARLEQAAITAEVSLAAADPAQAAGDQVRLRITCPQPCCLIVGNYWDAGWHGTLRDRFSGASEELRIERFAGVLQCLEIDRGGEFEIELRYLPASVRWGVQISWMTAGLLLLAAAFDRIRCRTP